MIENPIVDEVHRIREEMLAEYGGDLKALTQAMREQTEADAKAGRPVVTLAPRPAVQPQVVNRKVG